jgi:hypothetical protein
MTRKYEINVQLGSIPIEGRIVRLIVVASDEATAKALASQRALELFRRSFGENNPILAKRRQIRLCLDLGEYKPHASCPRCHGDVGHSGECIDRNPSERGGK